MTISWDQGGMLKVLIRKVRASWSHVVRSMGTIRFLNFPLGRKAFLVGTPLHTNLGDSAIVLAEVRFLSDVLHNGNKLKELAADECSELLNHINPLLTPRPSFFGMGGGNMGDLWFNEEALRRALIGDQIAYRPVILPQTMYYSATPKGRAEWVRSIPVYNDPRVTLVAREQASYSLMRASYPLANVLLTPDIVLYTTMADYGAVSQKRKGALFCVRHDPEKCVDDAVWEELESSLHALGLETRRTDMYSDCPVTKENRKECVRRKMQEFCGAELVVTDRLHGMVFAALTGTPCIAFGNYNHKVKGTYDWISYLPYVKFAETSADALGHIPELLSMGDCHYDNKPLLPYFSKLAEIVRERLG